MSKKFFKRKEESDVLSGGSKLPKVTTIDDQTVAGMLSSGEKELTEEEVSLLREAVKSGTEHLILHTFNAYQDVVKAMKDLYLEEERSSLSSEALSQQSFGGVPLANRTELDALEAARLKIEEAKSKERQRLNAGLDVRPGKNKPRPK